MKIAYLINKLEYGGAEMQVMTLAREQHRNGHHVIIVTLQQSTQLFIRDMDQVGISVHCIDLKSIFHLPISMIKVYQLLSAYDADVVHSHMFHSNMMVRLLYPFMRKPIVICTAHNIQEGGKLRDYLYRLTDSLCDATTNVSGAAVKRYNKDGLVKNNACVLIENGLDSGKFSKNEQQRNLYRKQLNVENKFVWLSVASLTRQKNLPGMLTAYREVTRSEPGIHLFMAGDGPERESINQLIEQLGLQDFVTLLGNRKDTVSLYSMADGFVLSSLWEGLPIALLEALSCSLPCVVTDVGGNSDVIIEDENGFLVPPGAHTQLAAAMSKLMTLPKEKINSLKAHGRRHILSSYDITSVAKRWINLYSTITRRQLSNGLNNNSPERWE